MTIENKPQNLTQASFKEKILESSQPALVDFWADWCAPCVRVGPAVERLAERFAGRAIVAKVNVDEEPELARSFGIRSIPALFVFQDGEVVERIRGEVPFGQLSESLQQVVDAVHKCREVICELDELLEMGFRGRETERVIDNIEALAVIETETDDKGMELVGLLFEHHEELNALEVVYWDRLIDLIGDIADYAEDVGDRLRLLIAR